MLLALPDAFICGADDKLDDDILASLQLFAGETTYGTEERRDALKRLLFNKKRLRTGSNISSASGEPEHLVEMRGFLHLLPYSDLEKVCTEIATEADI